VNARPTALSPVSRLFTCSNGTPAVIRPPGPATVHNSGSYP
jgi:hypothetical protein